MKYLNTYKIFESFDTITQNIKDILMPVFDMGYDIDLNKIDESGISIRVIQYGDEFLDIKDVKDEFERLDEYLKNEGYKTLAYYVKSDSTVQLKREIEDFISNSISNNNLIRNLLFISKKIKE